LPAPRADATVYTSPRPRSSRGDSDIGRKAGLVRQLGHSRQPRTHNSKSGQRRPRLCHGFLRMTGTKKARKGSRFLDARNLCLARKEALQIVHEHTSVPFYMDGTLRPASICGPEPRAGSRHLQSFRSNMESTSQSPHRRWNALRQSWLLVRPMNPSRPGRVKSVRNRTLRHLLRSAVLLAPATIGRRRSQPGLPKRVLFVNDYAALLPDLLPASPTAEADLSPSPLSSPRPAALCKAFLPPRPLAHPGSMTPQENFGPVVDACGPAI